MNRYPFPQTPCIVPGEIATLFQDFEQIGVVADHILDLYLLSHVAKNVPHDLGNPYQYMRKVAGLTTDTLAIRYTDFEKTFNRNYPLLQRTSALDFLSAYEAAYCHKADDSGLNNGMIYERFFAQVAEKDHIIMLDPPASFINILIDDQRLAHTRIKFYFTNNRYAEVLQKDPRLRRFAPRGFRNAGHLQVDKVLIFSTGFTYEQSKTMLSTLHSHITHNHNVEVFALLPTAFMDQVGEASLRSVIGKLFSIHLIVLIPAQATHISPRKRCMLVMRPGVGRFPQAIIQNTKCIGEKPITNLMPMEHRYIPHDYLMQSSATLYSLYEQAKPSSTSAPKRKKTAIYRFSQELSIGYSVCRVGQKFRPKFTPFAPPTTRQLNENHEGHGSALCKAFSGKLYPSQDALIQDIERFYFRSPKIREATKALPPQFTNRSCSLKTFWYLHQEQLISDARYDCKLAEDFFLTPHSWDSSLCALDVCTANTEELSSIVDEATQAASMSDTRKRNIVKQLEVIFDWVRKIYPNISSNPITSILQNLLERPDALHAMRDNMVRRSWTHAEEMRLLGYLTSDTTSPDLALASLIRLYTGISIREVCALVWDDYQRIPRCGISTLTIRRTFSGNDTTPIPLATEHMYRKIPVCQPLEAALAKRKATIAAVVTAELIDEHPIISSPETPELPVRPKNLIAYERALLEQLALPELRLHVPNEEATMDVDINDYQGDWMRSNFRYHCQHDAHMDTDEIRYCLGVRPNTTAAQHYNSNLKETSQLRMCCAINRWAAMHYLPEIANTDVHTLRLHGTPRTISPSPSLQPTEIVLDIYTGKAENAVLELSILARHGMSIAIEESSTEEE